MRRIDYRILNCIMFVLLLVFASSVFLYTRQENARADYEARQSEQTGTLLDAAINLVANSGLSSTETDGREILSFEDMRTSYRKVSIYTGTYKFEEPLPDNCTYQVRFRMKAESAAAKVNVSFGKNYACYLTTQWREFSFICSDCEIRDITWQLSTALQKIYLTDVYVMAYNSETDLSGIKTGSYSVLSMPNSVLSEDDGLGIGASWDVTGDGEYLYTGGNGRLTISKIDPNGVTVVSTVDGLGNIRHLSLKDENLLGVASRETGVYLVDIQDKNTPILIGYYDPQEIANDVCFSGNYMFVAGRYFGVEIVDITDPSHPVYVSRIVNEKECYRCVVEGELLFVSCWATREVEVYDISKVNCPTLLSTVSVEGRCGEAFVCDSLLYVVSGYNGEGATSAGNPGYGTGNGVVIYDISDIKRPLWCSTIQTEGSLQHMSCDDWSIQVSSGYVYFTNSFGGVYIYDVSDAHAPIPVTRLYVPIYPDSENFQDYSHDSSMIFPYNESEFLISPAMGIYIDDGAVFVACAFSDVYRFMLDMATSVKTNISAELTYVDVEKSVPRGGRYIQDSLDIYAIASYSEGTYVAGSSDGVLLLSHELTVIDQYSTPFPVKDIAVTPEGDVITAETRGIGAYIVNEGSIKRCGYLESMAENCNVSAIAVTEDGGYAITQSSFERCEAVDLHDISSLRFVEYVISEQGIEERFDTAVSIGNLYYRNIVSGHISGSIGIAGSKAMIWFESHGDRLTIRHRSPNWLYGETNGIVALNDVDTALAIYQNGYVIFNPFSLSEQEIAEMEPHKLSDIRLRGKISFEDGTLAVSNEPAGVVYILDISSVDLPKLKGIYHVEDSPGIALIEQGRILVPLRHSGFLEITL